MGALERSAELTLRRANIDNLKTQVKMLQNLIAEEERVLLEEEGGTPGDFEEQCACGLDKIPLHDN